MALVKNSIHTATITGYTSEGAGVCRIDGQVVFVPGTICGEKCEIRIVKAGKNLAYGKLERVLTRSPERMEPACPAFPKCGGCDFWHMSYQEELRVKQARVCDALERVGGIHTRVLPILGAHQQTRYRNKALFPVASAGGRVVSGFYRPRSHDVVETSDCLIQSDQANLLCALVCKWAEQYRIPIYDEISGDGVLRHVFVRGGDGGHVLYLVCTRKPPHTDQLIDLVRQQYPQIRGIGLNINAEKTNVVLGARTTALYGDLYLEDTLCGMKFRLAPRAFYQVNRAQAERLYELAVERACPDGCGCVLDLYCGAGTITLCLARRAQRAIGVEVVPEAVEDAKANARRNRVENAEFYCADAGEAARRLAEQGVRPDTVCVDPPRSGLGRDVIDVIVGMSPDRVVYVSCDPATLARDLKLLCECGGYRVESAAPVDMFPRTRHVETICLLSKLQAKQ